jgi:hypothetical protein
MQQFGAPKVWPTLRKKKLSLIDLGDDTGYNTWHDGEISVHLKRPEISTGQVPDPRRNLRVEFDEAEKGRHVDQPRVSLSDAVSYTTSGTGGRDALFLAGFAEPSVSIESSRARPAAGPIHSSNTGVGHEVSDTRHQNAWATRQEASGQASARHGYALRATRPADAVLYNVGHDGQREAADTRIDRNKGTEPAWAEGYAADDSTGRVQRGKKSETRTRNAVNIWSSKERLTMDEVMHPARGKVKHYDLIECNDVFVEARPGFDRDKLRRRPCTARII